LYVALDSTDLTVTTARWQTDQALGQQRDLASVFGFHEALHPLAPLTSTTSI